jgi:uncharacterized protein (DUF2147 family)
MRHAAIAFLLLPFPALAAAPVTGSWLTDTKDGIIEIAPCGNRICGRLAQSLIPIKGPPFDRNNPDPAQRGRPIIGLPILTGFVEDGAVWRGTAYDPKAGKSYKTTLERTGADRLKVRGCVAIFCRTVTWTRAK